MMQLMTRHDIVPRPDGDRLLIGGSSTHPCRFIEIAEQIEAGMPDTLELVYEIGEPAVRIGTVLDVAFLLEAGQIGGIVPGEPEGPVGHDALGVDYVAEHLANAPFSGCVAEVALLLGKPGI